jgi:glycosyltransferase involved in cell wall biosynthesis
LEIIFSDDNSPDNTFKIIEDAVKDYKGPHKIVLNRNEKNLRIGGHISKVWCNIAKGDWIVVSAGDDISLPNRVERLMEFANNKVSLIHHNCISIDENSQIIPDRNNCDYSKVIEVFDKNDVEETIRTGLFVKGATMCLNKKMLNTYGTILPEVSNEDKVLAYRAQHFGKIIHLDDVLMKYRMHPESCSYHHDLTNYSSFVYFKVDNAKKSIGIYKQILIDNKILNLSAGLLKELERKKKTHDLDLFLYSDEPFKLYYLQDKRFFFKLFARILLKPVLFFKRLKKV